MLSLCEKVCVFGGGGMLDKRETNDLYSWILKHLKN